METPPPPAHLSIHQDKEAQNILETWVMHKASFQMQVQLESNIY